jgi:hypothetical protein
MRKIELLSAQRERERGVSSLFVVIFTCILLTIISISFIGLMVREQQRAIDDQLSRSAYDAALSGVEDGKRVLAACQKGSAVACTAITNENCNTVQTAAIGIGGANEVLIQSSDGSGGALDQAYTCVKIRQNTPNYKGLLNSDSSAMVPLRGTAAFDRIEVSWFTQADNGGLSSVATPSVVPTPRLTPYNTWSSSKYPPVIRFHFMQHNSSGSINQDDFDTPAGSGTAFLYPANAGSSTINLEGIRRTAGIGAVSPVKCQASFPVTGFACSTIVILPNTSTGKNMYLRVSSVYRQANFQLRLLNGMAANPVDFSGVQSSVDSTGRANDIFRRVEARVESTTPDIPYPRATVDITNNLCKDFSVTATNYSSGGCNPASSGP